jgi:tetratricopeptide (TPR) repeat protein
VAVGLQQYDEAEQLLTEAAERFRTLPGHPVDGLVGCLGNLAGLQWTRGQRQAAKSTQELALEHSRQQLPAAHYLTSVGMTNLAFMVAGLGDRERAIELLREASSRAAAAGRAGEARLQRQRLAELLRAAGRAEEAAAIEDQGR